MYSPLQMVWKYARYWLTASSGKGHGIHSPFVFEFIEQVLNNKHHYYCFQEIENLRHQLHQDETKLTIEDFGAGSRANSRRVRTVQSIARFALKPRKFGQLLFRIANYYQPKQMLELGTSLGITSAYLASANRQASLITMEGAEDVASVARQNFSKLGLENITLIAGNFDDELQGVLLQSGIIDLAFIDGNHRLEPTVNYFLSLLPHCNDHSILIFDDIHWSREMEAAWQTIKADVNVLLTIDLFFIGLVFFRKEFKVKQHFTIRF